MDCVGSIRTLRQFVELWRELRGINLTDQEDAIQWKITAAGTYTAKSAYEVQFTGAISELNWESIWKAKVQNKCKVFAWLLLQCRLPTNDRIIRRGGQANPTCSLCSIAQEKTLHIISKCTYAAAVWSIMAQWSNTQLSGLNNTHRVMAWWERMTTGDQFQTMEHFRLLIYTAWHLWKERCRRVFDNKSLQPSHLASIIQSDISAERLAWNPLSE